MEEGEQKAALIAAYRDHLHSIPCKYHKAAVESGDRDAVCPFGNRYFYRHVNPDGSIAEGEDPKVLSLPLSHSNQLRT